MSWFTMSLLKGLVDHTDTEPCMDTDLEQTDDNMGEPEMGTPQHRHAKRLTGPVTLPRCSFQPGPHPFHNQKWQ